MKTTAIIMAGGRGERFWPKSRKDLPKQFLSLTADGETMIQKTVARITGLVALEDIFIVTNRNYIPLVLEQLPEIPKENIIAEPVARNTAPCVGLAASLIQKKYGDAIMLVLPSDHLIKHIAMFTDTLNQAISVAEKDRNLVTVGITPTSPETGYGYIHFCKNNDLGYNIYNVERFVEKPNAELAKEYLDSGEYLWNSGMFVWKASSILQSIAQYLPDMLERLTRISKTYGTPAFEDTLETVFPELESISIDFGVMEKADDIYTIPGNFGWDDVGSWLALERINRTDELKNMVTGDVITINTRRSIICGGKKLLATVGVEDLIIVDTDDATLICAKDDAQNVKKVLETLRICNRNELI